MAETKKLGELLKEAGLIDDFQLQSALAHQRNWGGKLGAVLVELDMVGEADIARTIAEKLQIPHLDLFDPEIPANIIKIIKIDLIKKYNVIPVKKESGALVVAMSDPLDIEKIDFLRFATGLNIKPALALDSEIKDAIKKYYEGEVFKRKPSVSFREIAGNSTREIELLHEGISDREKTIDQNTRRDLTNEETASAAPDTRVLLDAIVSLLIEKKLITRDELVSMIYQKKIGL